MYGNPPWKEVATMTFNYATFTNPERADQAYVNLLERGASPSDLVVITKSSYKGDVSHLEDGRLEPSEETPREAPSAPEFTHLMTAEALLGGHATTHYSPGHARILDALRFPGDLANALKEIGFAFEDAEAIENAVLHGSGLLIVMSPSGSVDENQIGEVIGQQDGQVLKRHHSDAYAS